jgi:cobalt/nickel transport system permease protein
MPGNFVLPLWAVHLPDGLLTWPWLAGGFAVAAVLAFLGSWRIRDEEIPHVAVLTAAFFVACQIGVPVPPTSVHLLLNGLIGLILGWRAALAIPIGLFLQAALFSHGGFTTLGINSCIMVLPALLARHVFDMLKRVPWLRQPWFRAGLVGTSVLMWWLGLTYGVVLLVAQTRLDWVLVKIQSALPNWSAGSASTPSTPVEWATALAFHPVILACALVVALLAAWLERRLDHAPEFPIGLLIGQVAVLASTLLHCLVLAWGGQENWETLAQISFLVHLPVAAVEGIILGFTVSFLARVKPEMLRWTPSEETKCSIASLP